MENQRWEEPEKRRAEERRSEKRKCQKKEDAGARKGKKDRVFPMICGFGGSKSRLAKAAGAEPSGQMRDEKLHAVMARSTFPSQNVQSTSCSDHFRKLRCRKSEHPCGAKHISKSKCTWAQGIAHLVKSEYKMKVCGISKNDGRLGTFEEDLQRCIFRGRRSTRDMSIRDVRRSGR